MKLLNEKLFFYYISIKTGFISFDRYKVWLNETFLVNDPCDDEILLELQFCTCSLEETIKNICVYLYDKMDLIDYHSVMKLVIEELKKQYNSDKTLYEITKKLYCIWCLLPSEISNEIPFVILNSIDDPWSWEDEKQIKKNIDKLLNYYRDN